jgi:hypothetical protein
MNSPEPEIRIGRFALSPIPVVHPLLNSVKQSLFVGATILPNYFRMMIGEKELPFVYIKAPFRLENRLDVVLAKYDITWRFRQKAENLKALSKDLARVVTCTKLSTAFIMSAKLSEQLLPHSASAMPNVTFLEEPLGADPNVQEAFFRQLKRRMKDNAGKHRTIAVIHPYGWLSRSYDASFIQHWIAVAVPCPRWSVELHERVKYLSHYIHESSDSEGAALTLRSTVPAIEAVLQTLGRGQRTVKDFAIWTRVSVKYALPYYLGMFRTAQSPGQLVVATRVTDAVEAISDFARKHR